MHSTYIVMDIKAIARWKTNINLNCTSSPEPRTQYLWPWFPSAIKWFDRLHSTKQSFQCAKWVAKFQPLLEF